MEKVLLKPVEVSRETFAAHCLPVWRMITPLKAKLPSSAVQVEEWDHLYFNDLCLIWQVVAVILLPLRYTPDFISSSLGPLNSFHVVPQQTCKRFLPTLAALPWYRTLEVIPTIYLFQDRHLMPPLPRSVFLGSDSHGLYYLLLRCFKEHRWEIQSILR